ncbi:LOW QUALITY PROTEIN: hypothetical protein CVT25_007539 [Psilocybe cyanescens]|uniref:PRP1 splicing factor N-terminal domain-containing protein n=1 Tax=Psilocybe cyanescens TaxID=93625 RepID=A0A409X1X7_PSICY|nr:LOW QUALITY PROTEIN: hypothetical protein CVT25_007539 [Psilocybe cyanescens]
MASNKLNKLAFFPACANVLCSWSKMRVYSSHQSARFNSASGFITRSDIGPEREGPSAEVLAHVPPSLTLTYQRTYSEAQAKGGKEIEIDPNQFQDPDNEVGLLQGQIRSRMTRKQIKSTIPWTKLWIRGGGHAEKPKNKPSSLNTTPSAPRSGSSSRTSSTGFPPSPMRSGRTSSRSGTSRKKRRREERTVLVGDRGKTEFENALGPRQQQSGGFETPAESGGLTNFKTASISEDVWIEAARLHNTEDAKIVLANAVQHVGQSVKIWLTAAALEDSLPAKKRVLRKALEHIPNSVRLWKETVNIESSAADARILLARAVEVIPLSVELWLALARLESPEKAKKVLNRARCRRATIYGSRPGGCSSRRRSRPPCPPASPSLQSKAKELEMVDKTAEGAVHDLRRYQVLLTREQWLKEAEKCELEGSPRTCEAIVKATVAMDVEEEDRFDTWVGDAESAEARGRVGVARAVLGYALRVFPGRRALWRKAAELEKAHGTRENLDTILERAVLYCPQAEVLWLMSAKEKWFAGDVPATREVLERAFVANPESEQIWLVAVKLEAENGEFGVARELLIRARAVADTERIWMKSAVFERRQGQTSTALSTLQTALQKFPRCAKLYMIQGQIHQHDLHDIPAARPSFAGGIKVCAKEPVLWVLASRLEEANGRSIRARALLEKAQLVNPANEVLWAEAVAVEECAAVAAAKAMLSRALQECPSSGLLWALALWSELRASRKTKSVDVLRKTKDSPLVVCTVARVLWADRMVERARDWFGRATATDPDLGDVWAWWLKFERQHGNECVAAEPHHSPVWQSIAKDVRNVGKSTKEILEMVADALK